jgi:alpha-beta hydrolase superfamily lysophospholipase
MTSLEEPLSWTEPAGLAPRGTLVVLPGRGEQPGLYERFGRRLAADAYRVHVAEDASRDPEGVTAVVKAVLETADRRGPAVLVGSDTGALLALRLVALGSAPADALVLAGLPEPGAGRDVAGAEIETRASCPSHQKLLGDPALLEPGALVDSRIPAPLREPIDPTAISVPVLGLHGDNDFVSPVARARARYAELPRARFVTVDDGRHDVLNAAQHRSVAATVVLFLERLRAGHAVIEEGSA